MKSLTINPRWRTALVLAAIPIGIALGSQEQARAIAAANAQSTAWQAVIAADKAEISALNAATSAAMKKGDPNAVVAAQQLIVAVSARLANEKRSSSFPPGFEPATNTTGLAQPELKLELARDKAVADAIISADQRKIASINASVAKDMKAGKAQLVVGDMSQLKTAQFQLAQDKAAAAMLLPRAVPTGAVNQPSPLFHPGGLPIGGQTMSQEQGHAVGDAIPADQWPKLLAEAMKPVEWNSVPSLAAELSRFQSNPATLIGTKVAAYAEVNRRGDLVIKGSRGPRARLSPTDEMQVRNLRHQLMAQFGAILKSAHAMEGEEYQQALEYQEVNEAGPHAVMAAVPFAQQRREQIRCSKITVPARREEQRDLRGVGIALRSPHNQIQLLAGSGSHPPAGGAVYGVIVGIRAIRLPIAVPSYRYEAKPFTSPMVSTRGFTLLARHQVYHVKLLYCGRAPKYISMVKKLASGPVKSYVFKMKSGTKMEATTYTTGDFYYHLKWNGINLSVAKDLVVKIIPVR